MSDLRHNFPDGFLWGTATSSHQVEGKNTNNDWWAFEQRPNAIWHGDRSGLACDWWHSAERDFDLMAEMGHNTHRLSVEWSRIEPEPGVFDPSAIARYREMLTGLVERGMVPMVTLYHFTTPKWMANQGGWQNPCIVTRFRRYVQYTVEHLGDLVSLWCTINEPNVYASLGYLFGDHAPGKKSIILYFRVLRHMLLAHGAAYRLIHALDGAAQVGIVKNIQIFEPLSPSHWASSAMSRLIDHWFNQVTLDAIADGRLLFPMKMKPGAHTPLIDSLDFFGLNYYTRRKVALRSPKSNQLGIFQFTPGAPTSDVGRHGTYGELYPKGLYRTIMRASELRKPLYITENGLPDADDDQRPEFLISHLLQVHRALEQGVDIRGYYHWSFVDNFEWAEGWALKFGLVALEPSTQERKPRPSAHLFSEVIRANAITHEMVKVHAPGSRQLIEDTAL